MNSDNSETSYLVKPLPLYFLCGLILVNVVAIFQWDLLYIGSFFAFLYIIITPGFLLLPFLTSKKLAPMLGIAFSVALSILMLMLVGLVINTAFPFWGMRFPLTTGILLIAFDVLIYGLLSLNFLFRKNSPFEFHDFDFLNWVMAGASCLLPALACLGAVVLNNGGSNALTMFALALMGLLVLIILLTKERIKPSVPPFTLCMMALSLLLMNSMRGWFVTGHDILLEYHVFILTNAAHLWNMAFYQDPYMACLSLTILPTYLVNLLHVSPAYIFKFFTQFLGALPVVMVYYLTKEYVSEKVAFLAGFLYVTFPTFMVDMAFLNRQGIAFLFFGTMAFVLLTTEYFSGWKRHSLLFLLGIGIIISHYSTSYITIALLVGTYVINRILRFVITAKRPQWFFKLTNKVFSNKEMFERPILLTLPFVLGLLIIMGLWSGVVTKTSTSFIDTVHQIIVSVEHPFNFDEPTGPARYSLVASQQPTPQALFNQFLKDGMAQENVTQNQSAFYPLSVTQSYSTVAVPEMLAPLTPFGEQLQARVHIVLGDLYNDIKQAYAKILQVLILIGLIGLIFGYSFKKNLLRNVPVEYIALSIAGIAVMVGQTVLPASAIDYGLLRLFQQNLIFLGLPIILGFLCIIGLIIKNYQGQIFICAIILLFFFIILSGFFPQFTGGGRAPLPLDNNGLYYDSYYTHAQEVYSAEWLAQNGNRYLPIQAAHFSDIKMIAYGQIGSYIELLPQTTKRDAYVYLNFANVKTSNILEIINGDVVYYHFPMEFLEQNKNLIYNNGGSEIYR